MSKKVSFSFDQPKPRAPRVAAPTERNDFGFGAKRKAAPHDSIKHNDAQSFATDDAQSFSAPKLVDDDAAGLKSAVRITRDNVEPIRSWQTTENPISGDAPLKNKIKPETWLARRGHAVTFAMLFLFTAVLYFRPYELHPSLAGFSSIAWFLAIGTILVFIPSQLAAENTLTARPPEVNYLLLLAGFGILTMPIARSPVAAWEQFNDPFLKVVLIFIVLVNVVRTPKRLLTIIWLALAVGVMLAFNGINNYASGNLAIEDYRAMAEIKGVFGNPNAQALHFVIVTPIAVALGIAARNYFLKFVYFGIAALFVAGNMVTYSRGGFLALIVAGFVLIWKFGRKNRFQVFAVCAVLGALFIAVAPGGYGTRVLSIFDSSLDPVGSSTHRKELLMTSIIVTLRNPWGIGMGNFPLANPHGLITHNSYTQVSSEIGVAALVCYLLFHYEAIRRLVWMERELDARNERNWIYCLNIGLQASFAAWCVGSFFDGAAYQWFLYYLAAYAISLRRIYQISQQSTASSQQQTLSALVC